MPTAGDSAASDDRKPSTLPVAKPLTTSAAKPSPPQIKTNKPTPSNVVSSGTNPYVFWSVAGVLGGGVLGGLFLLAVFAMKGSLDTQPTPQMAAKVNRDKLSPVTESNKDTNPEPAGRETNPVPVATPQPVSASPATPADNPATVPATPPATEPEPKPEDKPESDFKFNLVVPPAEEEPEPMPEPEPESEPDETTTTEEGVIAWDKVTEEHVNQELVAEGKIVSTGRSGGLTFLNFDNDRDSKLLYLFVTADGFPERADKYFDGKMVRVKGTVVSYKGRLQIKVTRAEQLKVVD